MISNANNIVVTKRKLVFKHVPVTANHEYLILQQFVEKPSEKEEIKKLGDWLLSHNIDVNRQEWYSSLKSQGYAISDTFYFKTARDVRNILPFLLDCKDDINHTNRDDQTILHVYLANDESCYKYSGPTGKSRIVEITKALLAMGASTNSVDNNGKTAVHVAIENKKFELAVDLLIDSFSNVDACDDHGNTVLHSVVNRSLGNNGYRVNECAQIVRILLSKGADPHRKNKKGMTAVQLAANKYNVDVLKIFKEHGVDFKRRYDDNLLLLVFRDNWYAFDEMAIANTIEFLANEGYDVNAKNENGYSALHYAAASDRAAEILIRLGADVNCQTKDSQQTPLHLAVTIDAKSKRVTSFCWIRNAVGELLRAGAYWDAIDSSGRTAFHCALESGNIESVNSFLQFGADINDSAASELIVNGSKQLQELVFSHAAKMKAIGYSVADAYTTRRNLTLYSRGRYDDCAQEVTKIKRYAIGNGMTIYQFLHMSPRRRLAYVDCLPRDLVTKFPIYADFILNSRNDAVRRNELLEPAMCAWYDINKFYLPDICVERIFYFLSDWSLKALIEAARTRCDVTLTDKVV